MLGIRGALLLVAAACCFGVAAESSELGPVNPGSLSDLEYDFAPADADFAGAEFIDWKLEERRLQQGGSSSTVTEKCNTWCMLKKSLGKTLVGLLLVCVAPCLAFKNEGRHVVQLRRIDFCKNSAVVVPDANELADENVGQLVHFVGRVSVDDDAVELPGGALNVTSPVPGALVLKRTVMIYQKFEQAARQVKNDTLGAGQTTTTTFTVREDWTPTPQPERLEHLPEETNSRGVWDELVACSGAMESAPQEASAPAALPPGLPPEMAALLQGVDLSRPPHAVTVSGAAHVGGFGLTREVLDSEPAVFQGEWTPCPSEVIPDSVGPIPSLRRDRYGNLTTVQEGDEPRNGDVMIKYERCPDGFDASFIVQQVALDDKGDPEAGAHGYRFGVEKGRVIDDKCCGSDDLGVIWMVRRGRHDLAEMIRMAKEDEKMVTKVLRVVSFALLVAGWMLLFSIFTTTLSMLPILGTLGSVAFFVVALIVGTVCCCGVTAVAYVRYRPLLAIGILALAGGIAGIVIWRLDAAGQASGAPTVSPTPRGADVLYPRVYGDDGTVMLAGY